MQNPPITAGPWDRPLNTICPTSLPLSRSGQRSRCHLVPAMLLLACSVCAADEQDDPKKAAFFEQRIERVLMDRCYKCHSSRSEEPAGGLLLDTSQGMRRGGDIGPAVVPGDPEESLLLSAMMYETLEMPPDEKLEEDVISDFRRWIAAGAVDPRDEEAPVSGGAAASVAPSVCLSGLLQTASLMNWLPGTFNWPGSVAFQSASRPAP